MNPQEELPENVLHFLDTCIDSIEQLWILMLLYSAPNRTWTVAEINAQFRSSEASIETRLSNLYSRGVLVKLPELKNCHSFTPSSDEVRSLIQELSDQYQLRPYRVIEAIYSRPTKALQAFADAFRLRGNKS